MRQRRAQIACSQRIETRLARTQLRLPVSEQRTPQLLEYAAALKTAPHLQLQEVADRLPVILT